MYNMKCSNSENFSGGTVEQGREGQAENGRETVRNQTRMMMPKHLLNS